MQRNNKIIGRYRIEYSNGFVQEKNLISGAEYEDIIKPMRDLIYDLFKAGEKNAAELKEKELKDTYGDFFTDASPMYKAIATGIMTLPESQGGSHSLKMELITLNITHKI